MWILLYWYFRDIRGALRPTITGVISAIWGLGFIKMIGFSLDPLTLVIPFFITARAVSHSVQMHDRYYEEYKKANWQKEPAIIASFAELFTPTLSGILTDALGLLVILLVPIVLLQKLAISAAVWILAITVSELLLDPIVYYYLREPDIRVVEAREQGAFKRIVYAATDAILSPAGKVLTLVFWIGLLGISAYFWQNLTIGDPTAASPLLHRDAPYNAAYARIQETFGGVEELIIVAERQSDKRFRRRSGSPSGHRKIPTLHGTRPRSWSELLLRRYSHDCQFFPQRKESPSGRFSHARMLQVLTIFVAYLAGTSYHRK